MYKLLKIEWKKAFYHRGTKIMFLLFFLFIIGALAVLPMIKPVVSGESLDLVKLGVFEFPFIWSNIAFIASIGKILLAIIIINNITNEFNYGTYKQNIIDGLSKRQFFLSKWYSTIILVLITTVIISLVTLILGLTYSNSKDWMGSSLFSFALLIEYASYLSLALFLAVWLKRMLFAFLGLFLWNMLEGILQLGELLFKKALTANPEMMSLSWSQYLPMKANGNINTLPNFDLMLFIQTGTIFLPKEMSWSHIGISLVYFIVFSFASYQLIKKRDVQ